MTSDNYEKNIDSNLQTSTAFEPHFKKKKVSVRRYNEDYLKYGFMVTRQLGNLAINSRVIYSIAVSEMPVYTNQEGFSAA